MIIIVHKGVGHLTREMDVIFSFLIIHTKQGTTFPHLPRDFTMAIKESNYKFKGKEREVSLLTMHFVLLIRSMISICLIFIRSALLTQL